MSQYVGSQMDFLPTFADLAGARLPPDLSLDGQSLAAVLLGKDENNTGHLKAPQRRGCIGDSAARVANCYWPAETSCY